MRKSQKKDSKDKRPSDQDNPSEFKPGTLIFAQNKRNF